MRDPAAAATPLTYWYNISQPAGAKPLHAYRANAWNDAQYDTSDEGVWRTASPDAYKTEPLDLEAAKNSRVVVSTLKPVWDFIAVKNSTDDGKLHPYRADSWNEANHNATNKKEYPKGMPDGYKVDAKKPTPTSSSLIVKQNGTANATLVKNTTTAPLIKALSKSANTTANATFAKNTTAAPVVKALSKSANTTLNATLAKNATKNATLAKTKDGDEPAEPKPKDGEEAPAEEPSLHIYRHDAWNEGHLNNTDKDAYDADSPQAYVVEPLEIGGQSFLIIKDPVKLHPYRHEAWNEANYNATHTKEYQSGKTASGATLPEHSTDGYLVDPIALGGA